jgi:hypothetical protein
VRKWPAIGVLATAIQSIYIKRDKEDSRVEVREQIKKRVQDFMGK